MKLLNSFSIKKKTYLLVSLSVITALLLSFFSNKGLNEIKQELDNLIFATNIERYTNKIILEEQRYRLNSNGSILNPTAANQAFENAKNAVDQLYYELGSAETNQERERLMERIRQTRASTDEYSGLYLHGTMLLNRLNHEAEVLTAEGEKITAQIQAYVEAKRVEVKKELSQKTIEKINAGSNVWQYTYVTRLHQKSYLLSPDEQTLEQFEHDYRFMMSELDRLRGMSDQSFEFERLDTFQQAADKYYQSMNTWVEVNQELVVDVLPRMKRLSNSIVSDAIASANISVDEMLFKRDQIVLTLITVTVFTLFLGVLFGSLIANSIISVIATFQSGLRNFFKYLNREWTSAQPISIDSQDEIAIMADVVNQNIQKIEQFLERKNKYQAALLEWASVDYQDKEVTFEKATELSAMALDVERVSIWLFNDELSELVCQDLYLRDEKTHTSGQVISEKDYPGYFQTIKNEKLLVADDAQLDERTRELNDNYLAPLNIHSMLDIPITQEGKLLGVVCHEKIGSIKFWEYDEQEFVTSVSNAISLSLEIKRRRDVQEELRLQKDKLHHQAHHDCLTGLPNRILFNDRLEHAISAAQRMGSKVAVLFIDLDHFKGVNDSLGHDIGDQLLIEVPRRLQHEIRKSDTLARLGGDEFTVVLEQFNDESNVIDITQDLLNTLQDPIEVNGHSFYVTMSVGVTIYPEDGETAAALLKNADAAMYQAKEDGRNTYQFYAQSMTDKAFERIAMETSFRRSLQNEDFVVYYQPQIDVTQNRIIGMEALARWQHPEHGLIAPDEFFPFAIDTGLIIPLDEWVMETAMRQFRLWHQQGLEPGVLALNLSIKQLQQANFKQRLLALLDELDFKHEWLELEITEAQVMNDISNSVKTLSEIKATGIRLSIDDFGTGYSSLSYLKKLPIHKVKIDQSFVRGVPEDEDDAAIIKTIIALSDHMRLNLIAEGVETRAQLEFLTSHGCHNIQGYLYHRPMPADDISTMLCDPARSLLNNQPDEPE